MRRPDCRKTMFLQNDREQSDIKYQKARTCAWLFALDPRHRARNRGYHRRFCHQPPVYLGGIGYPLESVSNCSDTLEPPADGPGAFMDWAVRQALSRAASPPCGSG